MAMCALPRGVCGPRDGEYGSRASIGERAVHGGAPGTTFHRVFGMHVEGRSVRSPSPQRCAEETFSRILGRAGLERNAPPSQAVASRDIHGRDRCWIDGSHAGSSPRRLAGTGQPQICVLGVSGAREEDDLCGLFGTCSSRSPSEDRFLGKHRGRPNAPKSAGVADLFATGPATKTRSPSPRRSRSQSREVSPRDHFRFENFAKDEVPEALSSSPQGRRQERPDWKGTGFVGRGTAAASKCYDVDNFRQVKVFPDSRHYRSSAIFFPGSPGTFDENDPPSSNIVVDQWGSRRGGGRRRSPSPSTHDSKQGALALSQGNPSHAETTPCEPMMFLRAPSKASFKDITSIDVKRHVPVPGEPEVQRSPVSICVADAQFSWRGAPVECTAAGVTSHDIAAASRVPRGSGLAFRSLSSDQFRASSKQGSRRLYPDEHAVAALRAATSATAVCRLPLSAGLPAWSASSGKGLSLDTTAAGTSNPSEPSVADDCFFGDRRRKGGSPFASPGSSPGSTPPGSPRNTHLSPKLVGFGWSALPHTPAGSRSASPARSESNGGSSPRVLPQDRSLPWLEGRLRPSAKTSGASGRERKQEMSIENAKRWK